MNVDIPTIGGSESFFFDEDRDEQILNAHSDYLEIVYNDSPALARNFSLRRDADIDAARAEAYVFSCLHKNYNGRISERPDSGGPDFAFVAGDVEFLVEVSKFDTDNTEDVTGLPQTISERHGGPFSLMASQVNSKLSSKASQFRGVDNGILFIVSFHEMALAPLSPTAIKGYAQDSMFLHVHDSLWDTRRDSIGAVVFANVLGCEIELYGVVHPNREYFRFVSGFPRIHWLVVRDWAIGRCEKPDMEWVIGSPPAQKWHPTPLDYSRELR